jgi:GNAT superfamily N-acetyltransferase
LTAAVLARAFYDDPPLIWLPPGHWQAGFREQIRALPHHARALTTAWGRAARYGHALDHAHPMEPHWYLKVIGVDPAWQGRGVASLLLRPRLNRCDQDGQPAYLEASKPDGVWMYEHFGFRRTGNVDMPEGAPAITAMWRVPANAAAGSSQAGLPPSLDCHPELSGE